MFLYNQQIAFVIVMKRKKIKAELVIFLVQLKRSLHDVVSTREEIKTSQANVVHLIAELRAAKPHLRSPMLILRGVLVNFHGHGKRNGSRARAPYDRRISGLSYITQISPSFQPMACEESPKPLTWQTEGWRNQLFPLNFLIFN